MPEVAAAAIVVGDGLAEMDALVNKQTISCCFNYCGSNLKKSLTLRWSILYDSRIAGATFLMSFFFVVFLFRFLLFGKTLRR